MKKLRRNITGLSCGHHCGFAKSILVLLKELLKLLERNPPLERLLHDSELGEHGLAVDTLHVLPFANSLYPTNGTVIFSKNQEHT